jgi:hypothetical protein
MAGARGILKAPPYQTPAQTKMAGLRAKRASLKLQTTTNIVQNLIDRKNGLVTRRDISALVQVTGTPRDLILPIIEEAKTKFSGAAVDYVDMHKQATQMALANGDAKSLDVATRAAQWAIEKIEHKGQRLISKEAKVEGVSGTKIMIGISLGGKNPTYLDAETIDGEKE